MTGIYTLKPSFGRFPTHGTRSGLPGQEAVRSVNGPMSCSLEAVELWTSTVIQSEPCLRDPNMVPLQWKDVDWETPSKLIFGLIVDDGIFRTTPPVTKALQQVAASLRAAGHEVIEWTA